MARIILSLRKQVQDKISPPSMVGRSLASALISEANSRGFNKAGEKFIALRDTLETDGGGACTYRADKAKVGATFHYNSITDTLYTTGYGRYVVYERGEWANPPLK